MNYDIIKLLKIKYELIDENKSFECYDNSETHIVELFLKDDKLRVCKQCGITEDISIISSKDSLFCNRFFIYLSISNTSKFNI